MGEVVNMGTLICAGGAGVQKGGGGGSYSKVTHVEAAGRQIIRGRRVTTRA